jgi:pimeloyl-ACP methyl ester carboxylesterase
MPELNLHGLNAFYRTKGEGQRSILCIHGAGGNSLHWMATEPPPGWSVIVPDLPGHGLSQGDPPQTISGYAAWVESFIETIHERPVLVGHSMGGAIALTVALNRPELLSGLVLVGTGAKLGVSTGIMSMCRGGNAADVESFLAEWAYGPSISPAQIESWNSLFGRASCEVYLAGFTACGGFDVREHLGKINLPTLIICGVHDQLTPLKFAQYLGERIPQTQIAEIPDAGHMAMLEQPLLFNQVLTRYCKELVNY